MFYCGKMPHTHEYLALAAAATAAIPGLKVVDLRPPQRTNDSFRVTGLLDSTGKRWVVVAPLSAAAGAKLEAEAAVLQDLSQLHDDGVISFDVPRPGGFAQLTAGGRAMVYRASAGKELELSHLDESFTLADSLGRCLASLHLLPVELVERAGLPVYTAIDLRERHLAELDTAATTSLVPPSLMQRWETALENLDWWRFSTLPVHGSLSPASVMVAGSVVVGLQDFSATHVGDPATDLAWITAVARDKTVDRLLRTYKLARKNQADSHILQRAELLNELELVKWLNFGLRTDNADIVDDAKHMLMDLQAQLQESMNIFTPPVTADLDPAVKAMADGAPVGSPDDLKPQKEKWEPSAAEDSNSYLPDASFIASTTEAEVEASADEEAKAKTLIEEASAGPKAMSATAATGSAQADEDWLPPVLTLDGAMPAPSEDETTALDLNS